MGSSKIGTGVLAAYGRQGLAELRAAMSFHSPIEQPTDYGMVGMATPGEAAAARQDDGRSNEADKHSVLGDRLNQVQNRDGPSPSDDKDMERD